MRLDEVRRARFEPGRDRSGDAPVAQRWPCTTCGASLDGVSVRCRFPRTFDCVTNEVAFVERVEGEIDRARGASSVWTLKTP